MSLGEDFPESLIEENPNELLVLLENIISKADLAQRAFDSHVKRETQQSAKDRIEVVAKQIIQLQRVDAICGKFMEGEGEPFFNKLKKLLEDMSPEAVSELRIINQLNSLDVLRDNWKKAIESHSHVQSLESQMSEIPTLDDRLSEWWTDRPLTFLLGTRETPEVFPTRDSNLTEAIENLSLWCEKWKEFCTVTSPAYEVTIEDEQKWAIEALKSAIKTALDTNLSDDIRDGFIRLLNDYSKSEKASDVWDIEELQQVFGSFEPRRIHAQIERIDKKIEGLSFNEAKQQWLERCANNPDALRALSQLKASLPKNNLRITEDEYGLFEKSLEILPIWVATGQAAQSIPLVAGEFDLILIDEASQCTLTNL